MSERGVQLVIGRLLMDRAFRGRVERGGSTFLAGLRTHGFELNRVEIATLIGVAPRFWTTMAKRLELGLNGSQLTAGDDGSPVLPPLTAQQQRVLAAICDGCRNKDIASQIGISESAVKATIQELFRKLSVRRRVQLVRIALNALSWRRDQARDTERHGAARQTSSMRGTNESAVPPHGT